MLDHKRRGYEQIMLPQRLLLNVTGNPRDCIVDNVKRGESLLKCFPPYENYMGGHSVKLFHVVGYWSR